MNEELRSTTEELKTGPEELQSVNEELTRANCELKNSVDELRRANSDLQNLMASTEIGTMFLDRGLRVQRFTPRVQELFNLLGRDLGRPLSDITSNLDYPRLKEDAEHVLRDLVRVEREVSSRTGHWFLVHLLPYRTVEDKIEGVVLNFVDITARRTAEKAQAWLASIVESSRDAIIGLTLDGTIASWNGGAERVFGYPAEEIVGKPASILAPAEQHRDQREILERLQRGETVSQHDAVRRRKNGELIQISLTISQIRDDAGRVLGNTVVVQDITERKRAEEGLQQLSIKLENEVQKFDAAMASVQDFIYRFDLEGRFTYANKPLLELWQKSFEEAVGKNFYELDYPEELAGRLQRQIQEVIEHGRPLKDETPYTSAFGARQYEYIFTPLFGADGSVTAVSGVTRDVTERREGEEALRESEARYRTMFERAGELRGIEERFRVLVEGARDYAMFLLDPKNKITFWSKGAERVFGWTEEEAIGQTGELIFTPEDRRKGVVESEIKTARSEGRAPDRRWHLRKDGSRFWADGVLMRLDDEADGSLRGFAKVARDATDQRRIEDQLLQARDEMEQRVVERTTDLMATNTELERTMAQREQLERELLEISEREKRRIGEDLHDMVCQELTATALLLKSAATKLSAENPAAAETLNESAQTVNRNVGVARDLARGLQAVDLSAGGLKNALRALALQACENRDITCTFKAGRGVRVSDDTVALHLYRIAQEAVTNALKHSRAKNVLISLDHDAENVCVTVQDDGKGFASRQRNKGLGLHIMKYRANVLGGRLKIQKRRSGGTEIKCVIPLKR